MKRINKFRTNIIAISALLAASSFTLGGCGEQTSNTTIETIFTDGTDATGLENSITDITSEEKESSLKDIETFESYLNIDKSLNSLDLNRFLDKDITITEENAPALLSPTELNTKLARLNEIKEELNIKDNNVKMCDDSIEFYQLAKELEAQNLVINNYINNDGYDTIARFGIDEAKATLILASGLDKKDLNDITIGPKQEFNDFSNNDYIMTYTTSKGKKITINVINNSATFNVIDSVYDAQHKSGTKKFNTEYNRDRINTMENMLYNIREATNKAYTLDKDRLYSTEREDSTKVAVKK
jgi:hypothetical protein